MVHIASKSRGHGPGYKWRPFPLYFNIVLMSQLCYCFILFWHLSWFILTPTRESSVGPFCVLSPSRLIRCKLYNHPFFLFRLIVQLHSLVWSKFSIFPITLSIFPLLPSPMTPFSHSLFSYSHHNGHYSESQLKWLLVGAK